MAVIGSVADSVYTSHLAAALPAGLPANAVAAANGSIGGALGAAHGLAQQGLGAAASVLSNGAVSAFTDSLRAGRIVAGSVALA